MHQRLSPRAAELLAKALSALAIAAGVAGFFGIDGPIKWGFAIGALAGAYWSWGGKLPTAQDALLCVFIILAVVFGVAWYENRSDHDIYDFVATPYKKAYTAEAWFPAPDHLAHNLEVYGYGEHVPVECITENENEELWYGLPNGNYILAKDLSPSPRTDGDPPSCN